MPGREGVKTVIVFVASIDAISHACIYKDAGLGDKLCDRIAWAAQPPTTRAYSIQPGKSVGRRVHRREEASIADYHAHTAFQRGIRRCLNSGRRIAAETPERRTHIHRDRAPRAQVQAKAPRNQNRRMKWNVDIKPNEPQSIRILYPYSP